VFQSSLLAVQKKQNPLGLKATKRIVCILIDGLGAENILARAGHAPFLASYVSQGSISQSAFPSTTSANIGSFATGMWPGGHGLIGHAVFDRRHDYRLNLLTGWDANTDPQIWQPNQTVSERAAIAGVACNVIGHAEYEHSGYTKATMREANYLQAESLRDRFDKALEVLNQSHESISYLYIPELDKFGHRNGWQSPGWAAILEDVDAELKRFVNRLPRDCGVVVTADHGMMDTAADRKVFIDDMVDQGGLLEHYAGDTRVVYLYLKDVSQRATYANRLEQFEKIFTVVHPENAVAANWYGPLSQEARDRMPDLMLLAKSNFTLFHSVLTKKRAYEMTAHHGGLTSAETRIPLIRIGV
jgi:predicted AlkP superfamily pyrophosphatase or phosphodiesterase